MIVEGATTTTTTTTTPIPDTNNNNNNNNNNTINVINEAPTTLRVRRMRSHFERLVRPPDITAGAPMPSIEGWVLFLTHLPPNTTSDHILDLFHNHNTNNNENDNNNNENEEEFEGYGPIREVKMPLDKNCECCGYALVELERKEAFFKALHNLEGIILPFAEGNPPAGESEWRLHIAPTFLGEEDEEVQQEPLAGEKRLRE